MHFTQEDERVVRAFTDCILEVGVAELTVDHIARKLGWSRASLYRQLGSWPQMVRFGYEAMLEWVDAQIPPRGDDSRVELERWWSALVRLFGSPTGRAVFAMRTLTGLHHGAEALDAIETSHLHALKQWCASSDAAFRATWALLRTAGVPKVSDTQRLELREIVWLIVGRNDAASEPELPIALDSLM